jgi:hypothetical protein
VLLSAATARLEISLNTSGGDIARLNGAMSDVLNMHITNSQRKLFFLFRIEKEQTRLKGQERGRFSAGFESAMAGSL